jgi:hypothetical protein
MKNFLFTTTALLVLITVKAQQNDLALVNFNNNTPMEIKAHENSKETNPYTKNSSTPLDSKIVNTLKAEILKFNIKESNLYENSEKATYRVVFKKKQGKAIVTYNENGTILSCKETYKNIKIPYKLRAKLAKEFPQWYFERNSYSVHYINSKIAKELYTIQIKKDHLKKTLKYNGEFIRLY